MYNATLFTNLSLRDAKTSFRVYFVNDFLMCNFLDHKAEYDGHLIKKMFTMDIPEAGVEI